MVLAALRRAAIAAVENERNFILIDRIVWKLEGKQVVKSQIDEKEYE